MREPVSGLDLDNSVLGIITQIEHLNHVDALTALFAVVCSVAHGVGLSRENFLKGAGISFDEIGANLGRKVLQ